MWLAGVCVAGLLLAPARAGQDQATWRASWGPPEAAAAYAHDLHTSLQGYRDGPAVYSAENLGANFIGQAHVIDAVSRLLRLRAKGLARTDTALSLALLGPPGTGKTELARRIASALHGRPVASLEKEGRFVVFDMTAYHDKASVQSWTGSPTGYEGTSPMREVFERRADAVVLLDEFEKGSCEGIPPLLLKMLDRDGRLTDKKHPGAVVSTANATFIMASNFAAHIVRPGLDPQQAADAVWAEMERQHCPASPNPFGPALRSRLGKRGLLVLTALGPSEVHTGIVLALQRTAARLAGSVRLGWTQKLVKYLHTQLQGETSQGMRGLEGLVERTVVDLLEPCWDDLLQARGCGNNSVVLDLGRTPEVPLAVRVWRTNQEGVCRAEQGQGQDQTWWGPAAASEDMQRPAPDQPAVATDSGGSQAAVLQPVQVQLDGALAAQAAAIEHLQADVQRLQARLLQAVGALVLLLLLVGLGWGLGVAAAVQVLALKVAGLLGLVGASLLAYWYWPYVVLAARLLGWALGWLWFFVVTHPPAGLFLLLLLMGAHVWRHTQGRVLGAGCEEGPGRSAQAGVQTVGAATSDCAS